MSDDVRQRPDQRWDPGARYRPSMLPGRPSPHPKAESAGAPGLDGRLHRGPARRVAVFDRAVWRPASHASDLAAAVERYRAGTLGTTGLARAVGRALGR